MLWELVIAIMFWFAIKFKNPKERHLCLKLKLIAFHVYILYYAGIGEEFVRIQ